MLGGGGLDGLAGITGDGVDGGEVVGSNSDSEDSNEEADKFGEESGLGGGGGAAVRMRLLRRGAVERVGGERSCDVAMLRVEERYKNNMVAVPAHIAHYKSRSTRGLVDPLHDGDQY